jgi:hypothetical protein
LSTVALVDEASPTPTPTPVANGARERDRGDMRLQKLFDRRGAVRPRGNEAPEPTDPGATARSDADELVRQGRIVDAVDLLAAANRKHRDPASEICLVELRRAAAQSIESVLASSLEAGAGRSPWPVEYADPFPGVRGRLPEIDAGALSADVMGGAVAHHGGLIVRGIMDTAQVEGVVAGMHRAEAQREQAATGVENESWYRPFPAVGGAQARARVAREGGIWLADTPANAAAVLDVLSASGVVAAIAGHLGERPFFSLQKSTLRHSLPIVNFTGWHQDGSFLGPEIRTMNVWTALSRCGGDRPTPGLEIVPKRIPEVLSTEGGWGPISVAPALVDEVSADAPPIRPEFEPGDGLVFDERFLHRTFLHEHMTEDRYAVECWMFAPSHASPDYLSFLA